MVTEQQRRCKEFPNISSVIAVSSSLANLTGVLWETLARVGVVFQLGKQMFSVAFLAVLSGDVFFLAIS